MLSNLKNYSCTPKVALQLFDALVSLIITYSCEVWGFSKCSELENLHLKLCKAVLDVRKSTSNVGVYGELGRHPLYINRYVRIVKYWFKITKSENIILRSILEEGSADLNDNKCNWFGKVRDLLCKYGFNYAWSNN